MDHVRSTVQEELLGLLFTGSIALGTANAHSDLDLSAVTSRKAVSRRFYRWTEMEIDVDLWFVTPEYIRACLKFDANAGLEFQ